MIGTKYIESLESGIIGALLIPTGMILLYAAAAIIDQLVNTSGSSDDPASLIFWIWVLAVVPLAVALAGILSSYLSSKYGPGMTERSIFSAISGIIAVVGGALLFLFIAAFLSPQDITSGLEDRLSYFVSSTGSLFTSPVAMSAMVAYVIIAAACGILYGSLAAKKNDHTVADS